MSMTENTDTQHAEPSSRPAAFMLQAIHKTTDGLYIFAPTGTFGNSFLLNKAQLPAFERWYTVFYKTKKKTSSLTKIRAAAIVVLIAIIIATAFDYISFQIGLLTAAPLAVLAVVIYKKEVAAFHLNMMKTFPFPNAPVLKLRHQDWLKKLSVSVSALPVTKWIAWWFLGQALLMLLIYLGALGLLAYGGGFSGADHTGRIGMIEGLLMMLVAILSMILLPLPFIMARRNFKKQTGHSLTTKNLCLYEMGRLDEAGFQKRD